MTPLTNLPSSQAQVSRNFSHLEKRQKIAYVALKVAAVLFIGGGIALTGGAAYYAWPKVTPLIVQGFSGIGPEGMNAVAKAIVGLIEGFIHVLGACMKMGGDIGGFCALFVVLFGIGIVGAPLLLTYGLPVVPGIALTAGGIALWCQTDNLVKRKVS